jgi:hypothetical protein
LRVRAPCETPSSRATIAASACARAFLLLPLAPFANLARELQSARDHPQHQVQHDEAADDEDEKERQRKLDPVRRCDQQCVAVAEFCGERGDHRGDREQQEPEKESHRGLAEAHRSRFSRAS